MVVVVVVVVVVVSSSNSSAKTEQGCLKKVVGACSCCRCDHR